MQDADIQISELAKALGHPARLRILRLLLATPGCIGGDILEAVGLAQSTVSEHLRILKSAGIFVSERSGPRTYYALKPDAFHPLAEFISALAQPAGDTCVTPGQKEIP